MQVIDNRGLNCPEPVIRTKRALDALPEGNIVSLVDNAVAKENVLRLVQTLGLAATVCEDQDLYRITITKGCRQAVDSEDEYPVQPQSRTVLLVQTEQMGTGDERLGRVLIKSFFYALAESADLPQSIFFLNSGIKLTCQGSPVLPYLEQLQARGVELQSCGTCLDFYGMKEQLAIGGVSNMYTIVEAMLQAGKTITLG
ncbi:MAG: sulfurtransferase-like selenium metabolism protein YedF [Bacillota bacterium]|jgi:selenium metabolism protein YedF